MGTPLGDFLRAKRDSIQPESLGLPERGRRRSNAEWLTTELAPGAGPEFTRRLHRHVVPRRGTLRINHPAAGHELRLNRETLELSEDAQQLVVFLPADDPTAQSLDLLGRSRSSGRLRLVP